MDGLAERVQFKRQLKPHKKDWFAYFKVKITLKCLNCIMLQRNKMADLLIGNCTGYPGTELTEKEGEKTILETFRSLLMLWIELYMDLFTSMNNFGL